MAAARVIDHLALSFVVLPIVALLACSRGLGLPVGSYSSPISF
jgi:hypothetical protein